jgi:hypothetical protein
MLYPSAQGVSPPGYVPLASRLAQTECPKCREGHFDDGQMTGFLEPRLGPPIKCFVETGQVPNMWIRRGSVIGLFFADRQPD